MTTIKEMRGYLRAEGKRAEAFRDLEEKLGEVGSIEKAVIALRKKHESARAELYATEQRTKDMKGACSRDIEKARERAEGVMKDAQRVRQDAERHAASANEAVADAEASAVIILEIAAREADELVNGRIGALAEVNDEIVSASKKRAELIDDISELEQRFDTVTRDMEAMRKRLG